MTDKEKSQAGPSSSVPPQPPVLLSPEEEAGKRKENAARLNEMRKTFADRLLKPTNIDGRSFFWERELDQTTGHIKKIELKLDHGSSTATTMPTTANMDFYGKDNAERIEKLGWKGTVDDVNDRLIEVDMQLVRATGRKISGDHVLKLFVAPPGSVEGTVLMGTPTELPKSAAEIEGRPIVAQPDLEDVAAMPVAPGASNLELAIANLGISVDDIQNDARRVGLMEPDRFQEFIEDVKDDSVLANIQAQLDKLLLAGVDDQDDKKRGITPSTHRAYTNLINLKKFGKSRKENRLTRKFPPRVEAKRIFSFFN